MPYLAIADRRYVGAARHDGAGMRRLAGTRELVALSGVRHGFDVASTDDIFTWTLIFLDAEVGEQRLAPAAVDDVERDRGRRRFRDPPLQRPGRAVTRTTAPIA